MGSRDASEVVASAYEAWNERGLHSLAPRLAAGVTLEDAPGMPDAQVTTGADAVLRRLEEVAETMGGGWVEIGELDVVAGAVLVGMVWKVDSASGPARTLGTVYHVVDVNQRDEIERIRVFLDRDSAMASAIL